MKRVLIALVLLLTALIAAPTYAYIGPGGAGIPVLGSLIGIIVTVILAIGAILFWPIRRLLRRRKADAAADSPGDSGES